LQRAAPFAGVWGVPKDFFLPTRAACGGAQKKKKGFFGDTPNPARGWRPLDPAFGTFETKVRDNS